MPEYYAPGLAGLIEQKIKYSPGNILGEAVEKGFAGFQEGRKQREEELDKQQKANADYLNMYIQLRQKGIDEFTAEKQSRNISGYKKSAPVLTGFEKQLEEEKKYEQQKRQQELETSQSLVDYRKALAQKSVTKKAPLKQIEKDYLEELIYGTDTEKPVTSYSDALERVMRDENKLKTLGADVDKIKEQIKNLPQSSKVTEEKPQRKGMLEKISESTGGGVKTITKYLTPGNSQQTKVIGGITYKKDTDGKWRPIQ
ncbi:MAG: hypothetical protein ABIJ17_01880 [Patescibacteria group bacterium]